MQSSLYNCHVFHKRVSPVDYGFTSRIFMWMLDLDEIDEVARSNRFFSRNRFNVYSFRDDDHLYLGKSTLRENVEAYLSKEGIDEKPARISLLTNLRTMGYVFNPVSFYFCYDSGGQAIAVIVEVHNTFGELKPFLLTQADLQASQFKKEYPKLFYISPFSDLDQRLEIKVELPSDRLALYVNNSEKGASKPFFRSSLTGHAVPLNNRSLAAYSLRFPFITLKVIILIHWHALKLYLKKVPFHKKSDDPHLQKGILPKKGQSLNISPNETH
ncbi:DUF1365 domain-containing protein [Puniceicoccales bacterium CK1056]|uniref:DUF1365 domain-containing protein n=1 Tax=Oceanipulchritudo coccoides TaxID=2706888 RepID=A0A6B2M6V7_9BACT|nr:DUF1365 domain-containing protein [Oceanipulchritudo coccoides]NDV63545.1 DUF1365 domain-containing protein [Oceanipulchritudo coccoides]